MKILSCSALFRLSLATAGPSLVGLLACSSAPTAADLAGGAAGVGGAPSSGGTGGSLVAGGSGGTGSTVDCAAAAVPITIGWNAINSQVEAFYSTPEALTLANNILYYRNADGGWPKDTDMTTTTEPKSGSTIDNSATTTQINYLSRVYSATQCPVYGDAAISGIDYLLASQYDNGGWPQEYPAPEGYHAHITFNDNAMVRVMEQLRTISTQSAPFTFVDATRATDAASAVAAGIECMLATQVITNGTRTGWCAQHDEITLEPAQARTYELPSLSGSEAVGIVRFLMSIENPNQEVRDAIEGAVTWFEQVKITGIRIQETVDASQPTGEDRIVVDDPAAPPIWARFYELETYKPIFSSRCEVPQCDADPFYMVRYSLAEIDNERRVGYAWYGNWPATLNTEYALWQEKWPAP